MASKGSKRKDRSPSHVRETWWVAAHPIRGLACGFGADGGDMLRLYAELDRELIEDIKELNEDDQVSEWRAVRVSIEVMD